MSIKFKNLPSVKVEIQDFPNIIVNKPLKLNMKQGEVYILNIGEVRHPIKITLIENTPVVAHFHPDTDAEYVVTAVSLRDARYTGRLIPEVVTQSLLDPTKEEVVLYGAKKYEIT